MVPKMKEGRPHENVASPWSKLKGLQLPKGIVVFEFPDGSDVRIEEPCCGSSHLSRSGIIRENSCFQAYHALQTILSYHLGIFDIPALRLGSPQESNLISANSCMGEAYIVAANQPFIFLAHTPSLLADSHNNTWSKPSLQSRTLPKLREKHILTC